MNDHTTNVRSAPARRSQSDDADRARLIDVDYVGLALIALGIGALQLMLDRGEDND